MNSTIAVGQTSRDYEIPDRAEARPRLFGVDFKLRPMLLEQIGGFFSASVIGSTP
ncbi:MAG TPA: hypothetical protein VKV22_10635 [Rhodanobacteraceae bacterium]|nr:hypothetical protein [Rhodanobacteraceae bacterium]